MEENGLCNGMMNGMEWNDGMNGIIEWNGMVNQ